MSTRISRSLRLLATAPRVSLEATTDATVQGQDGKLSEEELAKVAAKAEESVVDDADANSESPDQATNDSPEETAPPPEVGEVDTDDGQVDPLTDSTTDPTDQNTEVAADDTATPEGGESTPVEEIETPAESDLAKLEDTQAVDQAEGADADIEGSETSAGETPESDVVDGPVESDAGLVTDIAGDPTAAHDTAIGDSDTSVDPTAALVEDAPSDTASPETSAAMADVPNDSSSASVVEETAGSSVQQPAPEVSEVVQAPATTPGPQTDASEAVQEVVTLTEALAQAQTAEEVVKEARGTSDDLTEIVDTAEFSNEQGGVTMEGFAGLSLAILPYANRLNRRVNFGISMESFRGKTLSDRLKVSLEDVERMIEDLDFAQPQLERQAIESLDRVVCALKDALPTAASRLKAVLSAAAHTKDDKSGATIKVDDGLSSALCVDGAMPVDLSDALQAYAQLGKVILGPYSEAACRAAKSASLLNNAINFSSTSVFWEKIGAVVDTITDPRNTLTRTQLESGLPGGTSLFDQAVPPLDATNTVLQKLFDYNGSYAPLETAVAVKCSGDATAPALSPAKIVLVGNALLEVLCEDRICERLDEAQKIWPEAQDSLRHLEENLGNAPIEIENEAGADFSQVSKFVGINYSLATWPLLNYLTNLVLTANAFVLYAERSLKAEVQIPTDPAIGQSDLEDSVDEPVFQSTDDSNGSKIGGPESSDDGQDSTEMDVGSKDPIL